MTADFNINLIDQIPGAFIIADFSPIKDLYDRSKCSNANDFKRYCSAHQEQVEKFPKEIVINRANQRALQLLDAQNTEEINKKLFNIFGNSINYFMSAFLLSSLNGLETYETDISANSAANVSIKLHLQASFVSTNDYSNILISIFDITEYKLTEEELLRQWLLHHTVSRLFIASMNSATDMDILQFCLKELSDIVKKSITFFFDSADGSSLVELYIPVSMTDEYTEKETGDLKKDILSIMPLVVNEENTIVNNVESHDRFKNIVLNNVKSIMGVPLVYQGILKGYIGILNKKAPFTTFEQQTLEAIAIALKELVLNKRIEMKLLVAMDELTALYQISSIVSSSIDPDEVIPKITGFIKNSRVFEQPEHCTIFAKVANEFIPAEYLDSDTVHDKSYTSKTTCNSLCAQAADHEKIMLHPEKISPGNNDYDLYTSEKGLLNIAIPLSAAGKITGVLMINYKTPRHYPSKNTLKLYQSIGSQIAMAIINITLYDETKQLSLHDPLTGLANRRVMEKTISSHFMRSKRYSSSFSMIMADIDHFKNYNDTRGHLEGDKLLTKIAEILSHEVRNVDIVIRYGGEEFLIVLPEIDGAEAFTVAERIRKTIEEKTDVTMSLGVASSVKGSFDEKEIIKKADIAMYRSKEKGRNRAEIYQDNS
jgi:diguanylate cyclase (GGDEF)-like protein